MVKIVFGAHKDVLSGNGEWGIGNGKRKRKRKVGSAGVGRAGLADRACISGSFGAANLWAVGLCVWRGVSSSALRRAERN